MAPASKEQLLQRIHQIAREAGLDDEGARVAVAIARTEGGLEGAVGDNGQSFGPFQFHTGGVLPAYAKARGLSVAQAGQQARTNIEDAARWALSGYLGQAIREGMRQGIQGPELATYAQRTGQRSQKPELAGRNYQALYGNGDGGQAPAGGGQTMEPQETGGSGKPTTGRAGVDELDAILGPIRERLGRLQAEYEKLQKEYDEQAYPAYLAAMEEYNVTLNPVVKEAAERRLKDIQSRQAQVVKEAEAERNREQRTQELISRFLTQRNQEIQDKLATGTLDLNRARHEWDKTLDQANLAQQGKISALNLFKDAIPQMGNEETARAAEQALAGWGSLLPGGKAPSFRPQVVPFDPMAVLGYGSGGAPQQAPPFTPPPATPQMPPAAAGAIAQGDPQAAEAERIAQQMRADQERRMRENLAMGQAAPSESPTMPVGYPDVPGYQPDDPEWASMSTYAPPPPVDMAATGPYGRRPPPAPAPTPVPWQSQPTPTPVPLAAQGTPTPFAEPTPLGTPFAGPVPWWEYIARGQTPGR